MVVRDCEKEKAWRGGESEEAIAGDTRGRWVRDSSDREALLYTEGIEERPRIILNAEGVICERSRRELSPSLVEIVQ